VCVNVATPGARQIAQSVDLHSTEVSTVVSARTHSKPSHRIRTATKRAPTLRTAMDTPSMSLGTPMTAAIARAAINGMGPLVKRVHNLSTERLLRTAEHAFLGTSSTQNVYVLARQPSIATTMRRTSAVPSETALATAATRGSATRVKHVTPISTQAMIAKVVHCCTRTTLIAT